jgi:hypothetical protein
LICQKCGTNNTDETTFCTKCGEFLVSFDRPKEQEIPLENPEPMVVGGKPEKPWKKWYFLIVGIIEVLFGIGMVAVIYLITYWIPFIWPIAIIFCVLMPITATLAIYLGHYRTGSVLHIIGGIPLIAAVAMGLLGLWAAVHSLRRGSISRIKSKRNPDTERIDGWVVKPSTSKKIVVLVMIVLTFVIPLAIAGINTAGPHPYAKNVLVPETRQSTQQISVHIYLSNLGLTPADQDDLKVKFEGTTPIELDWTGGDLEFGKDSLMKTFYTGKYIKSIKVIYKGETVHEKILDYQYVSEDYPYW